MSMPPSRVQISEAAALGKVIILGGSGYIGRHLFTHLGAAHAVASYHNSPFDGGFQFDVATTRLADADIELDGVTHCVILSGISSPDFCFNEPAKANAVNIVGIRRIVDEVINLGLLPVFASTEAVFDGKLGNYSEADAADPILVYGQHKLEIENYLRASGAPYLTLRIAKVYDSRPGDGALLSGWYDQLRKDGEIIRCASDFISSAIHVGDLCRQIEALMNDGHTGLFHLGGSESLSRLDMCEALAREMNIREIAVKAKIVSCSIHDFPTAESRPLDISMNTAKLVAATGVEMRNINASCRELLDAATAA